MNAPAVPRKLKQFVLKPTVFCYHRCPYCDQRQDYYREMVSDRKRTLPLAAGPGSRRPNPGHMPLDLALRTIDEAAALGMEELQLSGGDPLLYPHLIEVIQAARKHPGVFVLMNSVGTGVTAGKARQIIAAGLGAWDFSVDTLAPALYARLRGVPLQLHDRDHAQVFDAEGAILLRSADGKMRRLGAKVPNLPLLTESSIADWVFTQNKAAGFGTNTLPAANAMYLPLSGTLGIVGVLVVHFKNRRSLLPPEQRHLLATFANQIAVAVERDQLWRQARDAAFTAQEERLRNSLLSSISHDLRTPLAVIGGSASSLLQGETQ